MLLATLLGFALLGLAMWHAQGPLPDAFSAATAFAPAAAAATPVNATPVVARAAESPSVATPEVPAAPASAEATRWAARAGDLLAVGEGPSSALDARLMRVYGLIAKSEAVQALDEARRLANEYPEYGLAQIVYADLLAASASAAQGFASPQQRLPQAAGERLRELVAEARARVAAAGRRPPPGTVPVQFVRLDPSVRHAIAVDVGRSRVYVFENTPDGPVVKRDYYASVGKLGMSKQVEGDLRTPLGVYFVTGRVPRARLDDRYGATALALNYPNQYDQFKGRTGSGIWLHGVEPALFTRAPLATDGCVALSNPDLLDMAQFIERQSTPVLIADQLEWVDASTAAQRNAVFTQTFEAWQAARQRADLGAQAKFYADDLGEFAAVKGGRRRADAPGAIAPLSMLRWKDEGNVMVVTYSESDPVAGRSRIKRQYWREQDGAWHVVYEGTLG